MSSRAKSKRDLKYYHNIFKVVGGDQCFILGAESPENRDLIVEKINH